MRKVIDLLPYWWMCIVMVSGIKRDKHHFNTILSSALQGQQVVVTPLRIFLEMSYQNCVFECKLLRRCRFINYYSLTRTCELIASDTSNVYVTRKRGVIFGNREEWDMVPPQICASCGDHERCRPEIPGCEIDACSSPIISNGSILIGNIFEVNARLKYACATGYSNTGSSYITCENNGQWTNNNTCVLDDQCPLRTDYQSVTLSDGTAFKYWLVQTEYSQPEAAALCLKCYGRLVEIITSPKLTFLRNVLINKADGFDYWIDGSNADAVDLSADDSWTTTSGAIIPMNNGLWVFYAPNNVYVEKCVRLKSDSGLQYLFDNFKCSESFRVICEYIN